MIVFTCSLNECNMCGLSARETCRPVLNCTIRQDHVVTISSHDVRPCSPFILFTVHSLQTVSCIEIMHHIPSCAVHHAPYIPTHTTSQYIPTHTTSQRNSQYICLSRCTKCLRHPLNRISMTTNIHTRHTRNLSYPST